MAVYTSGDWRVKPGREQEFIEAWRKEAGWINREFDPAGWGKLLRDTENPTHFVSIGEWPNEAGLEEWRASDSAQQRVGRIRELLEDMSVRTFELAAEVGGTSTSS